MTEPPSTRRKGRPPLQTAASHAAIVDAVYALLQEKSVRDLTIEEVAKRARVGKPTIYKWWPTKATLVLAMLCERMAPNLEMPTDLTALWGDLLPLVIALRPIDQAIRRGVGRANHPRTPTIIIAGLPVIGRQIPLLRDSPY